MKKIFNFLPALLASALLLFSCAQPGSSDSSSQPVIKQQTITFDNTARAFELGPDVVDVTITNVQGKKIYFARGNLSAEPNGFIHSIGSNAISAENLSYISSFSGLGDRYSLSKNAAESDTIPPVKTCFLPEIDTLSKAANTSKSAMLSKTAGDPLQPLDQLTKDDIKPGTTKIIFNITANGADGNQLPDALERSFTAMAVGDNVIIWRISEDENGSETTTKVTQLMCEALRDNFEEILPYETELFGAKSQYLLSEFDGSADRNPLENYSPLTNFTNILIYDFNKVSNKDSLGYFYFYDYVNEIGLSNYANVLYINDTNVYDSDGDSSKLDSNGVNYDVYNTIAHEYMHSLQFGRKVLETNTLEWNFAYGELLGQLCEYIFAPKSGVPSKHTVIPFRFNSLMQDYYFSGIMEYTSDGLSDHPGASAATYPNVLAFGLFLIKNYGGQQLLSEMVKNPYSYWDSIIAAIKTTTGKTVTKEELFLHYLEAYNCKGSTYYENLKEPTTITAQGDSITELGFDPLDLTWNGYFTEDENNQAWVKGGMVKLDGANPDIVKRAYGNKLYPLKLRGEGGYHICTVGNSLATDDTVTLKINRRGAGTKERLYILISD